MTLRFSPRPVRSAGRPSHAAVPFAAVPFATVPFATVPFAAVPFAAVLFAALAVGCAAPAPRPTTPRAVPTAPPARDAAALAPVAAAATLALPGNVDLSEPPPRRARPNAELLAATKKRFHGDCIRAWNSDARDVSIELGPRGRVLPTPNGAYVRLYARW